jgi:hypothetical protein
VLSVAWRKGKRRLLRLVTPRCRLVRPMRDERAARKPVQKSFQREALSEHKTHRRSFLSHCGALWSGPLADRAWCGNFSSRRPRRRPQDLPPRPSPVVSPPRLALDPLGCLRPVDRHGLAGSSSKCDAPSLLLSDDLFRPSSLLGVRIRARQSPAAGRLRTSAGRRRGTLFGLGALGAAACQSCGC